MKKLASISKLRLYKQPFMLYFREIRTINPKLTQKQFSEELGNSHSAIKILRKYINMKSPITRSKSKNNHPKKS